MSTNEVRHVEKFDIKTTGQRDLEKSIAAYIESQRPKLVETKLENGVKIRVYEAR